MTPDPVQSPHTDRLDADLLDRDFDLLDSDCSAMIRRLHHFLDGELTDERRTRIQQHLDDCPSCFGAFDFEAELRIVVRARVHTTVPQALIDRIRDAICSAPGER